MNKRKPKNVIKTMTWLINGMAVNKRIKRMHKITAMDALQVGKRRIRRVTKIGSDENNTHGKHQSNNR